MAAPAKNEKKLTQATVWSNGVNEYITPEEDSTLSTVYEPVKWLDALENIQSHREAPVTADEIDESIQFRTDALPPGVSRLISVLSASNGYTELWDQNDKGPGGSSLDPTYGHDDKVARWIIDNAPAIQGSLISHPYHIWPIRTANNHWEVIFMVFETTPESPDEYGRLSRYAIIDPQLSGGKCDHKLAKSYPELGSRAKFLDEQHELFLSFYRDSISRPGNPQLYERMIWVPKQPMDDNWSSGLRVIQFAWEMLERIQDMETSRIRNIDALFRPMRPYFNPDYVRLTAAGAIAARGLERENFSGRICLARVRDVRPKGYPRNGRRLVCSDLYSPLALPPIQRIPQLFLDAVNVAEGSIWTGNTSNVGIWSSARIYRLYLKIAQNDIGPNFKERKGKGNRSARHKLLLVTFNPESRTRS
ncbi:hypothetical protein CIB48_g2502 [Xylaria polymorpha]|nr:hypothetical protein CIB48_g2502 [Xylaria polymorpha]